MKANELVAMVHENAVRHGWWGDMKDGKEEERSYGELLALIHSEWSEALEEFRAGRPMLWYPMNEDCGERCGEDPSGTRCTVVDSCPEGHKPEGIAVELIDGVIRILDLFGHYGFGFPKDMEAEETANMINPPNKQEVKKLRLPEFVNFLHVMTAMSTADKTADDFTSLAMSAASVFVWVRENGLDPMKVLMEKHNYNITRPWKHNKVC